MQEYKLPTIKLGIQSVLKDLQTTISVCYLIAVGIGMLFNFKKYAEFGLNIFDYADILDFLIAPFGDVVIILFTAISLLAAYSALKADRYWEQRFPKSYAKLSMGLHTRDWYSLFRYGSSFIIFIFYLWISADLYGRLKQKSILTQPTTTITFMDNEIVKGIVIGKTKDVLFALVDNKVVVIPMTSSVKKLEVQSATK